MADLGAIGRLDEQPVAQALVIYPAVLTGMGGLPQTPAGIDIYSGTTRNDAGALASRRVVALRRCSFEYAGEAVSNATTGAYEIKSPYVGEHVFVCLDDAAGTTYNDRVLRV